MRVLVLLLALIPAAGCKDKVKKAEPAPPTPEAKAEKPKPVSRAARLKALAKVASCDTDMPFCFPVDKWDSPDKEGLGDFPDKPYMVGVSVRLEPGVDAETAVKKYYSLAILRIGREEGRDRPWLNYASVLPNNDPERGVMDATIASIGKVTRGEKANPQVPGMLVKYLDKQASELMPIHTTPGDGEWRIDGSPAYIRRIGHSWVLVEHFDEGATQVFVFPSPPTGEQPAKPPAKSSAEKPTPK